MAKPAIADLYIGQTLKGRFLIRDYLNRGNFSLVFSAYDSHSNREVAVKVLQPNANANDRIEFDTECELLSMASNAAHVVDHLCDGDDTVAVQVPASGAIVPLPTRFLVLERAESSLAEILAVRNKVSWVDRLSLYRGAVKGVHQLHLLNIAHRDTKADNILIVDQGGLVTAKVADLGRSRHLSRPQRFPEDSYRAGRGDFRFAPPEFLFHLGRDGKTTWQYADLYFLGSLLFEIATGQGLTTASLGDVRGILAATGGMTAEARLAEFAARRNDIQTRFESSYLQFRNELPPQIVVEGERLLRQLTSTDPTKRAPRRRGRKVLSPFDLQWVMRRIDIMTLALTIGTRSPSPRKKAS